MEKPKIKKGESPVDYYRRLLQFDCKHEKGWMECMKEIDEKPN